jgi:hypothetical protein
MVFSPLMVVLLLSTMIKAILLAAIRKVGGGAPIFFPVFAFVFPLFHFPTLLSIFQIKFFFYFFFFPTLLVCLFSLYIVTRMFFPVQIAINF